MGLSGDAVLLEGLADLVDRVVLLAQGHDQVARRGLLRLRARAGRGREEELGVRVATELVAEHAEGAGE